MAAALPGDNRAFTARLSCVLLRRTPIPVRWITVVWPLLLGLSFLPQAVRGEDFVIQLDDGRRVQVTARLAGSGQEAHALEFPTGQLQLIPASRLVERIPGPDPEPLTCDEMLTTLETEFGKDRLITEVNRPYVIAFIRATNTPLTPPAERSIDAVVKKAGQFFRGMQTSFLQFMKQSRVETAAIKYPLVALIFESDRQFDAYAVSTAGQEGLSAQNIAAFYDLLSNRLVIRLRECSTFDTPLHEAVHQQVYNRGILQRLAPIPAWFNEGIATGFEGDGERLRGGPKAISDRYGQLALRAQNVSWRDIVANDLPFQGDVLAAEAYGHAWGLHWLLVTKYRSEYYKLVRHYAAKTPLSLDRPDERVADFEQLVGKTVQELQEEFRIELPRARSKKSR